MKPIKIIIICMLSSLFIFACTRIIPPSTGILSGHIDIGPLCPVARNPPDPNCRPTAETYKAWPVAVWDADRKHIIAQIVPDANGNYQVSLAAGNYIVDLENSGTVGRSNLPQEISIYADGNKSLDISIDTGIR